MITHIRGKLIEKNPTNAVIEANGVGYWINISLNTYAQLPDTEAAFLYTYFCIVVNCRRKGWHNKWVMMYIPVHITDGICDG